MVYQCFGLFYGLQNDRLNQHFEQMKVFQLARGASQVCVCFFFFVSCMNKTNTYRWISICHTLHTFDCAACFYSWWKSGTSPSIFEIHSNFQAILSSKYCVYRLNSNYIIDTFWIRFNSWNTLQWPYIRKWSMISSCEWIFNGDN